MREARSTEYSSPSFRSSSPPSPPGTTHRTAPKFFEGQAKAFTGLQFNLDEEVFELHAPAIRGVERDLLPHPPRPRPRHREIGWEYQQILNGSG
jgi:hypothetical protein